MATAGTRRPTTLVILVGILPVLLVAALAAAPQTGRRTIYVTALDRNGRPVPGLTADDFRVKEDGRVREIVQVELATEPMQIALLLDDGGPSLAAIRQATGQFVERLQRKSGVLAHDDRRAAADARQLHGRSAADLRGSPEHVRQCRLRRRSSWTPSWNRPATSCAARAVRPVIVAIVS